MSILTSTHNINYLVHQTILILLTLNASLLKTNQKNSKNLHLI